MNIVLKKPDGTIAVSFLSGEANSPASEAENLQQAGAIPGDWVVVSTDMELPPNFAERTWKWDDASGSIVIDAAAVKAAIWDVIKVERDRRKTGGFKVGAQWFHSDADSRIQHLGLKDKARDLIAAGGATTDNLTVLGQPVRWKTMDGSFAIVTAQLAFEIVAAAGDLDARLFAVAETHRAAMEAAADPAAYDFSAGWPETFGG